MQIRTDKFRILLPSWERAYFGLALLIALLFVFATPLDAPDFNAERDAAITRHAGTYDAGGIQSFLNVAQNQQQLNDVAEADALRQLIDDRLRRVDLSNVRTDRELFLGNAEKTYPMPPIDLEFPTLPATPAFDLPIGDGPAPALQTRPTTRDPRPVSVVHDDDENPYKFDDREGQ